MVPSFSLLQNGTKSEVLPLAEHSSNPTQRRAKISRLLQQYLATMLVTVVVVVVV